MAYKGRLFVLSVFDGVDTYLDVLRMRTNDFTANDEFVDITTKASAGWREGLPGAGTKTVSMSGDGIHYNDTAVTRLTNIADQGIHTNFAITSESGDKYQGMFALTNHSRAGAHNGEETFTVALESAGVVNYYYLALTIQGQDETDFDGTGLNGTFTDGADYEVSDTIGLDEGTVITVDAVDGGGAVTQFTVTTITTDSFYFDEVVDLAQATTSGIGTGFAIEVGNNNITKE